MDDGFDLGLVHGLANLALNDRPAVAVEHRAEEVEVAGDVQLRDVDMPAFVVFERLHEALALFGGSQLVAVEQARPLEVSVESGGAHSDDGLIEHHVGELTVGFEQESAVVVDDLLSPSLQPAIPGIVAVVGMGPAVVLFPEVLLAGRQVRPREDSLGGQLGTGRPIADVIAHLVTGVGGNPAPLQGPPAGVSCRAVLLDEFGRRPVFLGELGLFSATTASYWAIPTYLAALAPRSCSRSNRRCAAPTTPPAAGRSGWARFGIRQAGLRSPRGRLNIGCRWRLSQSRTAACVAGSWDGSLQGGVC